MMRKRSLLKERIENLMKIRILQYPQILEEAAARSKRELRQARTHVSHSRERFEAGRLERCCEMSSELSFRMANSDNTFGFELFSKLHHCEIQKKEDIIIIFVHWYLVKYGFRCIGIGDSNVFNASQKGSELLPKDWNTGPSYALRYVKNDTLYLFSGIKSDNEILINLVKLDNDTISNIAFPIEETVSALHGSLKTVIPSYETILHQLQNELLKPFMLTENTMEAGTQTNTGSTFSLPTNSRNPRTYESIWNPLQRPPNVDPGRVGSADLYPPHGGHIGGMIFDPFSNRPRVLDEGPGIPGRLPPGAVPPGARFDPFGPPDLNVPRSDRRRPDNDDFLPPRFMGDDMFM
ncbi:proteasome inhibitor PI31 subunit isoform X2 [Odontomachus brunneus]|uniref:proteasome inhibitor PI31 subunit isoform X2 n=1 Tax=Odontomachus brunneus TaxID=486640 RepID=UPI0013F2AD4D|nr:proteasome inhibitor PI31 subunit isoform X2 [Odontomachus brunneus]